MAKLHLYTDGRQYYAATSLRHLSVLTGDNLSELRADGWRRLPDEQELTLGDTDEGPWRTQTCSEWCSEFGAGFVCSEG
jgi:hypothetical protein